MIKIQGYISPSKKLSFNLLFTLNMGIENVIKKKLSELGNANRYFQIFYNSRPQPFQFRQLAELKWFHVLNLILCVHKWNFERLPAFMARFPMGRGLIAGTVGWGRVRTPVLQEEEVN